MSERDAFGRRRDEDTLAGMGWREPTFVATLEGAADDARPVLPRDRGAAGVAPGSGRSAASAGAARRPDAPTAAAHA